MCCSGNRLPTDRVTRWGFVLLSCWCNAAFAQTTKDVEPFRVIAFYTARNDAAHISFVAEAHRWFTQTGIENNFVYDTTRNWTNLNAGFLSRYRVVIFLDTRPEDEGQRKAFEAYMKNGGAWMGFHFAAFALTPSAFPQNWSWYHETFLGAGEYKSNTWRPTAAVLRVEKVSHPAFAGVPEKFSSAPNEWYCWRNDLRQNPDIEILLSIDPASYPLGTGPKPHEIWHEGYYPVAWTNTKYHMLYFNMGHNDIDYENKTNKELSSTFSSAVQNQVILNGLLWLAQAKTK